MTEESSRRTSRRLHAGLHCERSEANQTAAARFWIASSLTLLVLLRHNIRRLRLAWRAPQHGHRGKLLAIASIKRVRIVAIEFGMCRSGRNGGSSGSVTVG